MLGFVFGLLREENREIGLRYFVVIVYCNEYIVSSDLKAIFTRPQCIPKVLIDTYWLSPSPSTLVPQLSPALRLSYCLCDTFEAFYLPIQSPVLVTSAFLLGMSPAFLPAQSLAVTHRPLSKPAGLSKYFQLNQGSVGFYGFDLELVLVTKIASSLLTVCTTFFCLPYIHIYGHA